MAEVAAADATATGADAAGATPALPAYASSANTALPFDTLSPSLTRSSLTTPAADDGMVALEVIARASADGSIRKGFNEISAAAADETKVALYVVGSISA